MPRTECLRHREVKRGTNAGFRVNPNPPPIPFDDFLRQSQADSVPGDIAAMQAAEDLKYSILVLWIDSDPVIAHRKLPEARLLVSGDVDFGGDTGAVVLNGIADEILQDVFDSRIGDELGQRIVRNFSSLALDYSVQMKQHLSKNDISVDLGHVAATMVRSVRVTQKIVNKRAHSLRALHDKLERLDGFSGKLFTELSFQ